MLSALPGTVLTTRALARTDDSLGAPANAGVTPTATIANDAATATSGMRNAFFITFLLEKSSM